MTGSVTLTVATWNVGNRSNRAVRRGINRLRKRGVDVIGLQECSDRQGVISRWTARKGWTYHSPDVGGGPAVPMLIRPNVDVEDLGHVVAVAGDDPLSDVGDPGAGPEHVKQKIVTYVDAKRFGRILNTHMTTSVTRVNLDNHEKREAHYAKHLDSLIETMTKHCAAMGDFNAQRGQRWLAPLREVARCINSEPTRGKRSIDLVWVRGDLSARSGRTIRMPSDHKAVIATLERE